MSCIASHCIALNSIVSHWIALNCIELHWTASSSCIVQLKWLITFLGFNGHFHSVLQHGHWKIFRGVRRAPQTVIDVASGGQSFFHDLWKTGTRKLVAVPTTTTNNQPTTKTNNRKHNKQQPPHTTTTTTTTTTSGKWKSTFSIDGIQDGIKWQFCKTIHVPSACAFSIIRSATQEKNKRKRSGKEVQKMSQTRFVTSSLEVTGHRFVTIHNPSQSIYK